MAQFVLWEMQVAVALCFLIALAPWLSVFDFVSILLMIIGAAVFGFWREV